VAAQAVVESRPVLELIVDEGVELAAAKKHTGGSEKGATQGPEPRSSPDDESLKTLFPGLRQEVKAVAKPQNSPPLCSRRFRRQRFTDTALP
jgi:hypothetical protein